VTIRIALALFAIVSAALAYPWTTTADRWALGLAIGVVLIVFAWWRGLFVTSMVKRRLQIWRRNHSKPSVRPTDRVTVVLRVRDPACVGLPLPLVSSYVERFGIRCDSVRVTTLVDRAHRATWVSMTLDAKANLAALMARGPELPLADTAGIVARRLADQLREVGLEATLVERTDAPLPVPGRETWTDVRVDQDHLTAFGLAVDGQFAKRVGDVWGQSTPTWTALEFGGTSTHPTVAAECAFRSAEKLKGAPVAGLVAQRGVQGALLTALDPRAVARLGIEPVPLPVGLLDRIGWPVESVNSELIEQTRL
jgi:type VII secretion protein EccE